MDPVTQEWRDSTALCENFFFYAIQAEPYVSGDYQYRKLRAHFDYALQVYARQITNESHDDKLSLVKPHVVGHSSLTWDIKSMHRLELSNTLSVNHPSYLQVCKFERTGTYVNQLWQGNPGLRSVTTASVGLSYIFLCPQVE